MSYPQQSWTPLRNPVPPRWNIRDVRNWSNSLPRMPANSLTSSTVLTDKNVGKRAEIDEEIKRLQDRIYTLRHERNALLPIGLLPPDLLIKIFALAIKERKWGRATHRLTWISHYWRRVILSGKRFWTLIDNSKLSWMAECLERTHGALLSVSLEISQFSMKKYQSALECLFKASPQFKRVHLSRPPALRPVSLESFWLFPAPALETFYIQDFNITNDTLVLLSADLRFFYLERCRFDWGFLLQTFSKLTSLSILKPVERIPVTQFLDKLHLLPRLEHLTLDSAVQGTRPKLGDRDEDDSDRWTVKHMHRHQLITVTLTDDLNFTAPLLRFLEYSLQRPRSINHLSISCTFTIGNPHSEAPLGVMLGQFGDLVSRSSGNLVTAFKVLESIEGLTRWVLEYGTPERPLSQETAGIPKSVPVKLTVESPLDTTFVPSFSAFRRNISLIQVHTLHIYKKALHREDMETLHEAFGSLDRLQHIRMQTDDISPFIWKLVEPEPETQDDLDTQPTNMSPSSYFPFLRTFGVIDPVNVRVSTDLVRVLKLRNENGRKLEKLILGTYSQRTQDEVVSRFREVVDEVVVENFGTLEGTKRIFGVGNMFEDVTLQEIGIREDFEG